MGLVSRVTTFTGYTTSDTLGGAVVEREFQTIYEVFNQGIDSSNLSGDIYSSDIDRMVGFIIANASVNAYIDYWIDLAMTAGKHLYLEAGTYYTSDDDVECKIPPDFKMIGAGIDNVTIIVPKYTGLYQGLYLGFNSAGYIYCRNIELRGFTIRAEDIAFTDPMTLIFIDCDQGGPDDHYNVVIEDVHFNLNFNSNDAIYAIAVNDVINGMYIKHCRFVCDSSSGTGAIRGLQCAKAVRTTFEACYFEGCDICINVAVIAPVNPISVDDLRAPLVRIRGCWIVPNDIRQPTYAIYLKNVGAEVIGNIFENQQSVYSTLSEFIYLENDNPYPRFMIVEGNMFYPRSGNKPYVGVLVKGAYIAVQRNSELGDYYHLYGVVKLTTASGITADSIWVQDNFGSRELTIDSNITASARALLFPYKSKRGTTGKQVGMPVMGDVHFGMAYNGTSSYNKLAFYQDDDAVVVYAKLSGTSTNLSD